MQKFNKANAKQDTLMYFAIIVLKDLEKYHNLDVHPANKLII